VGRLDGRPGERGGLADSVDAQLIGVCPYRHRTLISLLLGSTPHKLLHIPHRPVLVVRG
jgi:nucleotide-binding universal stress UspA family protein